MESTSWCSSATSGNLVRDVVRRLAPQARGLQHVGLVHRGDAATAARARAGRRGAARARSPPRCSAFRRWPPRRGAGLGAEVGAAGQLAHEHHVHAGQTIGLSGDSAASVGCTFTGRRLANTPSSARRRSRPCSGAGARSDRTTSVRPPHPAAPRRPAWPRSAFRRQRVAVGVDGAAADGVLAESKVVTAARGHRAQHAHRRGGDFRTDAVARQDGERAFMRPPAGAAARRRRWRRPAAAGSQAGPRQPAGSGAQTRRWRSRSVRRRQLDLPAARIHGQFDAGWSSR